MKKLRVFCTAPVSQLGKTYCSYLAWLYRMREVMIEKGFDTAGIDAAIEEWKGMR